MWAAFLLAILVTFLLIIITASIKSAKLSMAINPRETALEISKGES